MHKVKDGEVHKVKDKVTNEVVNMYKDLWFSVRAGGGGFGVFMNKKKTPIFFFWEWTIDAWNKFYTWSQQKIFLFSSVILVHICPK